LELLSPANSGNWVLGAGPTAIFPTATSGFTGQGKWQLGPTVVVGYLTKEFFIGVFPQQWWSIGGQHSRPDTNQMNLQPIATIAIAGRTVFTYSGEIAGCARLQVGTLQYQRRLLGEQGEPAS
jgi:hypothetical protein